MAAIAADAHFKKLHFKPQVRLELGSNEAVKKAVAGGLGLSVLSRHALGTHTADDGLVELPVVGFPIQSRSYLVHLRDKRLSPIAQEFQRHFDGPSATGYGRGQVMAVT